MLGFIYILISTYAGFILTQNMCRSDAGKQSGYVEPINLIWIQIPAAFGVGTLLVTWVLYITAWIFSCCFHQEHPLYAANGLVLSVLLSVCIVHIIFTYRRYHKKECINLRKLFINGDKREILLFAVLFIFSLCMFFYVFFVKDGLLYSGFTVFSDYAPHTAMIRSFSRGNNFPTQYPHFGGEDVKYHFMYQFLVGNLEFLGMRIDLAYNIVSACSLTGFLILLFCLVKRMTGGFLAGVFAMILFFFRSGTAFFQYVAEHIKAGDLWETLNQNSAFIGYTTNENWGFWNFNVYLNQRHLAFGLLIGTFVIWKFLDYMEAGCYPDDSEKVRMQKLFCTREGWMIRKPESALLLGLVLGLTSFWNGAVVIGSLLILAGIAVFSIGKLDFALMAAVSILFSILQSKLFITGSAVSPSVYFGFLADVKTVPGVLVYLFKITGFFFLGLVLAAFQMKRKQRALALGFSMPLFFAFFFSLTPDIAVNHKYIMIAYAFMTIFWAGILEKLFKKKLIGKLAAVLLTICLTATGIYDFVIIIRNNGEYRSLTVELKNDVTDWLCENLSKNDLILTPEYSMNSVTMSGTMLYCGWPYYAWSAGYDTYYRADIGRRIYGGTDREEIKNLVEQEAITYILFEEDVTFEDVECHEETIADLYPLAYTSESGRMRIYKVK
ncbi:MAG: hypothetical protein Q4B47_05470 [Eubacteriales bacterium]|nr:hypothetical protein [Eubacteriales bacterium]